MAVPASSAVFRRIAVALIASTLAVLIGLAPQAGAAPAPLQINIPGIGTINMSVPAGNTSELSGSFQATRKNPDGSVMTLRQLEKSLGQDHLNWFQKVTSEGPNPPPPGVTIPFVDPPNGGLPANVDNTWADNRPWYYDEYVPTAAQRGTRNFVPGLQLSAQTAGSTLSYSDQPGGQKGNTIGFSTFLISVFGNRTYNVLGQGFNWSTKIDNNGVGTIQTLTAGAAFTADFQKEIKDQFGWQMAHQPDTAQNTTWVANEKGPAGAVINVQLTSNGQTIKNADGSLVQYSQSVPANGNQVTFTLPRTANGQTVTDATQWTGQGRDPGTLYFSVFDSSDNMITEPLTDWLTANEPGGASIYLPDFSLDSTDPDNLGIFYGVNLATIGSEGMNFVNAQTLGDMFSIGSLEAMLPDYVFSTTPLQYTPGQGWTGTAPDPSLMVSYDAFHDIENVPEPAHWALLLVALGGLATVRLRRRQA